MKIQNKLIVILLLIFSFSKASLALPINQFINVVSPPMNAVSVNKISDIVITFTQDMNPASMNAANIKVFGYQTGLLPVIITYDAFTKTLILNPPNDLKLGEIISISLTSGLKTIANENITPFVFSFRVQSLGGTGIFTRGSGIDSVSNGVNSGDIDGDGKIDIIVGKWVYKNNGNAVFSLFQTLDIHGAVSNNAVADFDDDGDLDILIQQTDTIHFFKNNGLGNFTETGSFIGGLGKFGDLNGDGFLDLSYLSSVTEINTMLNHNGVFQFDTTVNLVQVNCNGGYGLLDMVQDDLDNDGDQDIVGITGYGRSTGLGFYSACRTFNKLNNNGSGSFNVQNIYNDYIPQAFSLVLGIGDSKTSDFNNDGYVDIASPATLLSNNHDGSFSSTASLPLFSNALNADFNGDGYMDLVVNFLGAPLFTEMNDQSGGFNGFIGNSNHFSNGSTTGDFDNDGDIDIAILGAPGEVVILLNGDNISPVELSSFTSSVNLNSVNLNWTTATEENNSGFDIERNNIKSGVTQTEWKKIGAVAGNGSSSNQNSYKYTDRNLTSGKYNYRLKQFDFNGGFKYLYLSNEVSIGLPSKFDLLQNYPNPFNPVTKIEYNIASSAQVTLKIYDVNGREVKTLVNEFKNAGYYNIEFNGSGFASGVYYYKIESQDFVQTKKMLLIK